MVFGGIEKFTLIDYPGKIACMVYTIGCNFRCPYCHNPELVDETVEFAWPEEKVLEFLEGRKKMLDGLVVTGGEPTIHGADLLAFLARVKALGLLVKLDSNGTNPKILAEALERKLVDYVAMDIKSPVGSYSRTVARPVDGVAIRESIALLMGSKIGYEFRTTLIKQMQSPADIEEILREIRGAKRYFLQKFVPTKLLNPQFRRKVTYSDDELARFQKLAANYVDYCGIR